MRLSPFQELNYPVSKGLFRMEIDNPFDSRDVGRIMPNVSGTKRTTDMYRYILSVKRPYRAGHLYHASTYSRPNVKRVCSANMPSKTCRGRVNYIVYINEISAFQSIFENIYRSTLTYEIGENCKKAGVRVTETLSRSVDILISQRQGVYAESGAKHEHHLLLSLLGETVE